MMEIEINDVHYMNRFQGGKNNLVFKITNETKYIDIIEFETSISQTTHSSILLSNQMMLNICLERECIFEFAENKSYTLYLKHVGMKNNKHTYKISRILESNDFIQQKEDKLDDCSDILDTQEINELHDELVNKLNEYIISQQIKIKQARESLTSFKKEKTIESINRMSAFIDKTISE